VQSVSVVFERKSGRKPDGSWERSLSHGEIRIGDLGTVVLPKTLLSCLPDPLIEDAVFEFGGYDPENPKWNATWWKDNILVYFRYGRTPTYISDDDTNAIITTPRYPYVEFIIKNLKISNIILTRGERDARFLDLAAKECPQADIDWSLRK